MNHAQNKRFHGLLAELGLQKQKANIVNGITNGRTSSSSEMSYHEAQLMISNLLQQRNDKVKAPRAKLLYLLGVYGMIDGAGKLDYPRINAYIENIGSNNPKRKKSVLHLTIKETLACLNQVQAMVKKELNS